MGDDPRALPLGVKLSFFTPDSEYHGGPGQGYGVRHFSGGAKAERGQSYQGYWKDDEQEGKGSLQTHEGTKYDGEWKVGAMHGEGTYAFQVRNSLPGCWCLCVPCRRPFSTRAAHAPCPARWQKYRLVNKHQKRSTYSGQWADGKKHGRGKLTLYSGNSYDGDWRDNKRHGWGLYVVAKPTIAGIAAYEGEWVEDARTGRGMSKGADGHLEICAYEDGKRVGEGVRILDESKLKTGSTEPKGPFRLTDGKLGEEIPVGVAEGIAAKLGFKALPSFPWPPPAAAPAS